MVKKHVDGIVLTSEDKIRSATKLALESFHTLIEPSGAAVIAALGGSYQPNRGENLVLVISGGNISLDLLRRLLNEP